jgi:putative ABC transport system permease protein
MEEFNSLAMISNYLKLSFRLLIRNPFFTLINVLGLSIGFAVFFILWQYSQNEQRSDQFHKGWENIVRFGCIPRWTDDKVNWEEAHFGINDAAFAEKISNAYPQIKDLTRILFQKNFNVHSAGLKHKTEIFFTYVDRKDKQISFREENVAYADENLFRFFSFPLIRGNINHVLKNPGSIVLSEKASRKYFGDDDPIGKTMTLNDSMDLQVTGVFKDLPLNTHLDFEFLISTQTSFPSLQDDHLFGFRCYFKLENAVDVGAFENQINTDYAKEMTKVLFGEWPFGTATIFLQPISEMAFTSHRWDSYRTKSALVLTIFKYSAIIILLLAWINYVNLNISSNKARMKEIAARKAVGAKTSNFAIQFIVESTVINVISCLVALTLIQLAKQPIAFIFHLYVLPWGDVSGSGYLILGLISTVGILVTGLYPCWVAMTNSPKSLFGSMKSGGNKGSVHASLATFQYFAAIVMLMIAAIVYSQMNFILNKNIGFDTDHVVVFDLPIGISDKFKSHLSFLQKKIVNLSEVTGATISQSVPSDNTEAALQIIRGLNHSNIHLGCNGGVDETFIPFYGIKLLAGRNFNEKNAADSSSIILSEAAIRRLGFKNIEEAIGSIVLLNEGNTKTTIIGAIADYRVKPYMKFENDPQFRGDPGLGLIYKNYLDHEITPRKISVRIKTENFQQTLSEINEIYASVFPGAIFNWYFLDDVIAKQYQTDSEARSQIALFTVVALIIAGLGLLGMISNRVVERTKEIGIRRVLGAQLHKIALILVSGTIKQVAIAAAIAIPVGYYIALQYLERFSERVTLQWWHYTAPVLILVGIMTVVISSILWKTAKTNPVEALRYE